MVWNLDGTDLVLTPAHRNVYISPGGDSERVRVSEEFFALFLLVWRTVGNLPSKQAAIA